MLQGGDGEIEHVHCLIYSVMYRKEILLRTKLITLQNIKEKGRQRKTCHCWVLRRQLVHKQEVWPPKEHAHLHILKTTTNFVASSRHEM
jgi:hypothetical protein